MKQNGGNNSTNIQANNIEINNGLSYSEARVLFSDLFDHNFLKFTSEAARIASERAMQLIEDFLIKLEKNYPDAKAQLIQPAMQAAIFSAQKDYAKNGDKNTEELLVDLLVEKANQTQRNLLQLSLDEALEKVSRISDRQLNILTLHYFVYKFKQEFLSFSSWKEYMKNNVLPFIDLAGLDPQEYLYLEYLGCAYRRTNHVDTIVEYYKKKYPGLFCKGFTRDEFNNKMNGLNVEVDEFLIPCFHSKKKYQICYNTSIDLSDAITSIKNKNGVNKYTGEVFYKLNELLYEYTLSLDEIRRLIGGIHPNINNLAVIIENSDFGFMELTPIGRIIAISNYNRKSFDKIHIANALYDTDKEDHIVLKHVYGLQKNF